MGASFLKNGGLILDGGEGLRGVGGAGVGDSADEKEARYEIVGLLVESGRGQAG